MVLLVSKNLYLPQELFHIYEIPSVSTVNTQQLKQIVKYFIYVLSI